MKVKLLSTLFIVAAFSSCTSNNNQFDASGTFEANEVIVSSELGGKILSFNINEGDTIIANTIVGSIDSQPISLQKEQIEASISALDDKTADVGPQIVLLQNQLAVQQSQLGNLLYEQKRVDKLISQDAATTKQLDDINAQIDMMKKQMIVTKQQINVQESNFKTQNKSILSENKPLQKRVAQFNDQLQRAKITNPITGTVLTKYAEAGEVTAAGKAMYKIADLSELKLRAYITGVQLPNIKLGQQVKVMIDEGAKKYKEYSGIISWISDKAEFTPKTIQTKEERANLVYAIKVKVKNDGFLKIGMYGEVKFK